MIYIYTNSQYLVYMKHSNCWCWP